MSSYTNISDGRMSPLITLRGPTKSNLIIDSAGSLWRIGINVKRWAKRSDGMSELFSSIDTVSIAHDSRRHIATFRSLLISWQLATSTSTLISIFLHFFHFFHYIIHGIHFKIICTFQSTNEYRQDDPVPDQWIRLQLTQDTFSLRSHWWSQYNKYRLAPPSIATRRSRARQFQSSH